MKGKAQTLKGEVTVELWTKHLAGKQGLGIIPIDETNRVRFAAIDIDQYPLDLRELNAQVQKNELPLIVCRTKSGGAHLFCLLETFSDAREVQRKMREMAATLGHGNAEIFPKQTSIVEDRGDVGSWINMPYFNSANTDRYALDAEGNPLSFTNFMQFIRSRIVSFDQLMGLKSSLEDILPEGPPCLNHLMSMGFPQGTRNNGLFNIAVYCRKAYGDEWESHVQEYNGKYMDPPLDPTEVAGLLKSVARKEFNYTCKSAPICNYCNMPRCRNKKFGIGGGSAGMPKFGSLTKLKTVPPVWFLEVESGGRIELTTDDLQNPKHFQNRCMETLNVMPIIPKPGDWQEIIHQLLQEVNEVNVPEEATPRGQLWQLLEDFCTSKAQARLAEEMLQGKPWLSGGTIHFRLRDFFAFLERQKFRAIEFHNIPMYLTEWKLGHRFLNLRGKGTNVFTIVAKHFERQIDKFEVPEMTNPEDALS